MHCDFVNPVHEPDWNRSISEFRGATFFHTAEWASVLAEAYHYRPEHAVFKDGARTVGIVPLMDVQSLLTGKRGVSLPFTDECPPLLRDGITPASLMEPLRRFGARRGWRYIELRGGGDDLPDAVTSDEFAVHRLTLEASEDLQRKKVQDSHRRNIQKSIREGVVVEHLQTREAMDIFYAMHCHTRRRHGLPPQPGRFFQLVHSIVIEPGHGFISLARLEKRWIAGAVFFQFGSQAVYKFGASDPKYQHLRANNLVMWEAITRFRKESLSELSFGRTDLPDLGLLQFKRGWGGQETRLRYHRVLLQYGEIPRVPTIPRNGLGWGARIAQRMPIPLLKLVGSLAYRHMA
jgi:hypothetical protein